MKKNKKIFLLIFIAVIALKCANMKHMPCCSLNDISFLIAPHIITKDGNYFLEYQIAVHSDKIEQRLQVGSFIRDEEAYYFFIGKTSYRELGNVVLIPLSQDNVTDFARKNAVYWLNADKSEVKLKISENKPAQQPTNE